MTGRVQFGVSIHAPVKGATSVPAFVARPVMRFNPRSREGSDVGRISVVRFAMSFNPRSREGSDVTDAARREVEVWFQSTLP